MKTPALIIPITLLLLASSANAKTIEGKARVSDGDSIKIDGTRIRLLGIDAPEKREKKTDTLQSSEPLQ